MAPRKPATVRYPSTKIQMPKLFRGKLSFQAQQCIGCRLCMRDCPTQAITIRKVADKQFEADVDLALCIYCAQCVDSCPKNSLGITDEFELAQLDRRKLRISYRSDQRNADVPPEEAIKPEPQSPGEPAKG